MAQAPHGTAQASLLDAWPDLFFEALVVLQRRITDLAGQVLVIDPSAFLIFSSIQKGKTLPTWETKQQNWGFKP